MSQGADGVDCDRPTRWRKRFGWPMGQLLTRLSGAGARAWQRSPSGWRAARTLMRVSTLSSSDFRKSRQRAWRSSPRRLGLGNTARLEKPKRGCPLITPAAANGRMTAARSRSQPPAIKNAKLAQAAEVTAPLGCSGWKEKFVAGIARLRPPARKIYRMTKR